MNYENDASAKGLRFSSFMPLDSSFPKIAASQSFQTGSSPRPRNIAATSEGVRSSLMANCSVAEVPPQVASTFFPFTVWCN